MSLVSYVEKNLAVNLEDVVVKEIYTELLSLLNDSLLNKTFLDFQISQLELCGSFAEGTRIVSPLRSVNTVFVEFDILAITRRTGLNSCEVFDAVAFGLKADGAKSGTYDCSTVLKAFIGAVKEALPPGRMAQCTVYGENSQAFFFKTDHQAYEVIVDLHPAFVIDVNDVDCPVYVVGLPSGWRRSCVRKEIALFSSSPEHKTVFRILKYLRALLKEKHSRQTKVPRDVTFGKYQLKTAVLKHILNGRCRKFTQFCVLDVLDILIRGYRYKNLCNIFTGDILLKSELQDSSKIADEIERLQYLLRHNFTCGIQYDINSM